MSDMEVLLTAWFFVMSAGLLFVSLLYWVIRLLIWAKGRRHQKFLEAADPMRMRHL
jgi:hypothetical protein